MTRLARISAVYVGLSVIAAVGVLVGVFPKHPTTLNGWLLLLVLALPLTIAGELVGEMIWRNRLARAIESNTKGQSLSGFRMLYALVAMLLMFGLGFMIGHFMEA